MQYSINRHTLATPRTPKAKFSPAARYLFTESGNDGSPLQYGALSLRSCRGSETPILGRSNPDTGENANPSREEPLSKLRAGTVATERNPLERQGFRGVRPRLILVTKR